MTWACFTRVALARRWGGRWDKAPYQMHAKPPDASGIHPIRTVALHLRCAMVRENAIAARGRNDEQKRTSGVRMAATSCAFDPHA